MSVIDERAFDDYVGWLRGWLLATLEAKIDNESAGEPLIVDRLEFVIPVARMRTASTQAQREACDRALDRERLRA